MAYHNDPNEQYEAIAPYNFVELNDTVVTSQELPTHDRFADGRLSGRIRCHLCTESPLYVGGPKAEDTAIFFHHGDPDQPVIPGSSLRGMIRNLVEIVSFSKLWPITDRKLFYRDINNKKYQSRFVSFLGSKTGGNLSPDAKIYGVNVQAGILHKSDFGYQLEMCGVARVHHDLLEHVTGLQIRGDFYERKGRQDHERYLPNWHFQGRQVFVDVANEDEHEFPANERHKDDFYLRFRKVEDIRPDPHPGLLPGVLVITGYMKNKKMEFVFLPTGNPHPDPSNKLGEIIDRLEGDDQISEWQQKAFKKDEPYDNARRLDGGIRDGEPVFYLEENGEIEFIGRAQLFRLPFGEAPSAFRPAVHQDKTHVDVAEAIFGFVDKPKPKKENNPSTKAEKWTAAGRVFFGDATLSDDQPSTDPIWLRPDRPAFRARILATPKPTAYAHYLAQQNPNIDKNRAAGLSNYLNPDARVRGHKLYWHRARIEGDAVQPVDSGDLSATANDSSDQTSYVKPLRPGIQFEFDIIFDNLTPEELGALLWALALPGAKSDRLRHKLGMGKPLGMGSLRLTIDSCELLTPRQRYDTLLQADQEENPAEAFAWNTGYAAIEWFPYIKGFETWMTSQLGESKKSFREQDRIKELQAMLSWPGMVHEPGSSVYMGYEAHKPKPVLPRASTVQKTNKSRFANTRVSGACDEEAGNADAGTNQTSLIGATLRGTVLFIDKNGDVSIELKGLPEQYDDYLGHIPADQLAGRQYHEDAPARIIVTAVDNPRQIILCRPAIG